LFDERDYLLGEAALTVAESSRQLGIHSECDRWLDRAEASFRHTLNPAPKLSEIAYLRLALKYDQRKYEDVVDLAPGLAQSFAKLEMRKEHLKTRFMRAMAIKGSGDWYASHEEFTRLADELDASRDQMLLGQVLVEIGSFYGNTGDVQHALSNYQSALSLLRTVDHPMLLAHLKATVAETLFLDHRFEESLGGYRDAISDYSSLGMETHVAYLRLVLADALLKVGYSREAEWEILAALPTIEEQKMVPEGFAAVALLKESVRRRKTDPNALRELREHLQANP
jgi:tetratricopeptide (TPR) repeat protein